MGEGSDKKRVIVKLLYISGQLKVDGVEYAFLARPARPHRGRRGGGSYVQVAVTPPQRNVLLAKVSLGEKLPGSLQELWNEAFKALSTFYGYLAQHNSEKVRLHVASVITQLGFRARYYKMTRVGRTVINIPTFFRYGPLAVFTGVANRVDIVFLGRIEPDLAQPVEFEATPEMYDKVRDVARRLSDQLRQSASVRAVKVRDSIVVDVAFNNFTLTALEPLRGALKELKGMLPPEWEEIERIAEA